MLLERFYTLCTGGGDHGGQRLGFVDFASGVPFSAQICLGW